MIFAYKIGFIILTNMFSLFKNKNHQEVKTKIKEKFKNFSIEEYS